MALRLLIAVCAGVASVALPATAAAQPEVFFQRLADLTAALEGSYGDEGPRIEQALDQMSRALAEWDRRLEEFGVRLASDTDASALAMFDRRVSLARMYAQRGRLDDALGEIDRAIDLEPARADAYQLRGLVLDASDRSADAAGAFAMAWARGARDPVNAYFLLRHATAIGTGNDSPAARELLAAAARTLLTERERPRTPPFPDIGIVARGASDMPLLPLAAYAPAYRRLARGDFDGAITAFRTAVAVDPIAADSSTRSPAMLQAIRALREGRLSEARARLENAADLRASSETYRLLGLIDWAGSDDDKSIEQFTAAIGRNPRDERSRLALFQVLRLAGRDDEAAQTLQDALRVLPDSVRAHWWLGVTYERMNRFVDARRDFERAAPGVVAGRSAVDAAIGRLAVREADLPAAADAFARAIRADPNDPAPHKYLAGVFLQQDRTDDALVEWIAALLIDPLDPDAYAGMGQLLLNIGRTDDAIAALRRAVELSPSHTEARYALAIALLGVGKTREAEREFARVEREQRQALTDRRRTMALDVLKEEARARAAGGDYERAAALWRQVIDRQQERVDPDVYRELAGLYRKLGRLEDAARAAAMYQQAVQRRGPAGIP